MKLVAFTIVLNGFPWLPCIFTTLNRLSIDWHWVIVHGAAKNVKCSAHCTEIEPQLSTDGTTEFLRNISTHPRIAILEKPIWEGKIEMVNSAVATIKDECVLMQIDADELWTHYQLTEMLSWMWDKEPWSAAKFKCRYFVGPHLITKGEYGNKRDEWVRAWRFLPGMSFKSHCPPLLNEQRTVYFGSWVFDHYSWATKEQVDFKTKFYGYNKSDWEGLQKSRNLSGYFPWVGDDTEVNSI